MSIETVNGYVCTNCTEAALAKRGIDPNRPPAEPALEPRAVTAVSEDERPRAALAYSQKVDKLA